MIQAATVRCGSQAASTWSDRRRRGSGSRGRSAATSRCRSPRRTAPRLERLRDRGPPEHVPSPPGHRVHLEPRPQRVRRPRRALECTRVHRRPQAIREETHGAPRVIRTPRGISPRCVTTHTAASASSSNPFGASCFTVSTCLAQASASARRTVWAASACSAI